MHKVVNRVRRDSWRSLDVFYTRDRALALCVDRLLMEGASSCVSADRERGVARAVSISRMVHRKG